MEQIKQKDILNLVSDYSLQVVTPEGIKNIELSDLFLYCIENYKKRTKSLNIKYYKKRK